MNVSGNLSKSERRKKERKAERVFSHVLAQVCQRGCFPGSVSASLPLWLVIWLKLDRLHHRWKLHYISPASLARCNGSHLKQSLSDQGPAGVICSLAVCVLSELADQDVFVFLDLSSDIDAPAGRARVLHLSCWCASREALGLVGVSVFSSHVSVWEHHLRGWRTTSVCLGSDQ